MRRSLNQPELEKSIMTAPVFDMRIERTIERHTKNPGSEINLNGISKLRPLDGYTRIVPAEYWSERKIYHLLLVYIMNLLSELN